MEHEKTARIFEDVGGYYICDEALPYLDTRGQAYPSKRAAMIAAYQMGYDRAIGSGTYWGNKARLIPASMCIE